MAGQLKQSQKFFANGVALQDNNRKKKNCYYHQSNLFFFYILSEKLNGELAKTLDRWCIF